MKKITKVLFVLLLTMISIIPVSAKEKVNLYLFWGDGCPHCALEKEYLEDLKQEFPNLNVTLYEVWFNQENEEFLNEIAEKTNNTFTGVPVTIIGQTVIKGFDVSTEQKLRRTVSYYTENKHHDIVNEIKEGTYQEVEQIPDEKFQEEEQKLDKETTTTLPIIGQVNFKNYDLLTAVPILGVLTSLSFLSIFLIIIYQLLLQIKKNKKERLLILPISLVLIGMIHILNTNLNIPLLNGVGRLIILLLTIFFIVNIIRKTTPSNKVLNVLLILFAISIGFVIPTTNLNILNALIEVENINIIMEILINFSYLISYLIPIILLIFILSKIEKKIPEKVINIVTIVLLISNIVVINII